MPEYRSVSQYKTYKNCPYQYKLERIDKVWQRPAAWLAQGTAVHTAAEMYERSERTLTLKDSQDFYTGSYVETINKACETTPNLDYWFGSGPYRGEADIERRYKLGLDQVGRYLDWYQAHPEEVIWVAEDGTPGIELGFDMDLDGVAVRGYIDAVIQVGNRVFVRDNKTGNLPGDDFQLAVYAVALNKQYDTDIYSGDYWMGRTGKPTFPYDLSDWPEDRLVNEFGWLDVNIRAENFDPDPEPAKCRFCPVANSCAFVV